MTDHGELDVETYSEAGHIWNPTTQKWDAPKGAERKKKGLGVIGAAAYAEHPSTDILTLTYRLPLWWPGGGVKVRWNPSLPPPVDLFNYLAAGGVLEFHNRMFEYLIWWYQLTPRYGWPPLPFYQTRCSMAKARVNSLPGALANLSDVLRLPVPKDKEGKRLLDKFSVPRNPTKADPRTRILPAWMPGADPRDAADFAALEAYCDTDIDAEAGASERMTPMSDDELLFWWVDQEINTRGVAVDRPAIRDCMVVLEQALAFYGEECRQLTGFNPTQLAELKGWLAARGVYMEDMQEETITTTLAALPPHPPGQMWPPRRVLELRQLIGSAAVKKIYAMENTANRDDRVRNLIIHHGARTGRPTGDLVQPLNLLRTGPKLTTCAACERPFKPTLDACPWCRSTERQAGKPKWSPEMADSVLEVMASRSLELVEWFFGNALLCIGGCSRSLLVAAPGHDLIASDYSAIEAVVIAMLAGEEWRIQAFRDNLPIYLLSAGKITGRTLEEYEAYFATQGEHHPDRQKIGKVNELANGFGGWIGASRAFGAEGTDDEIKGQIIAWRDASPAIVELWGGQTRWTGGKVFKGQPYPEMFGLEGAAVQAILYPGQVFDCRGLKLFMRTTPAGTPALIIRLLSGRELTYHQPSLTRSTRNFAQPWEWSITYWTWNSNSKYGAFGWVPMSTFGGRLTENVVQAIAHDILRHAILNLRALGYPTVLHVYDEIVVEVPHGCGSLAEVEATMAIMPAWAQGWPVRASGGWRGRRYRKG